MLFNVPLNCANMTGKFVAILVLLCVSQLAVGDKDLAQEKKEALARIKVLIKSMEVSYTKACEVFHNRPVYFDNIRKTHLDLGYSLLEQSLFEVKKNAEGAKQKAKLLPTSAKMSECIEARREETSVRLRKAHDGFTKSVTHFFDVAWKKREFNQDRWSDRQQSSSSLARNQADIVEDEIAVTNNKAYLDAIMASLEKTVAEANRETLGLEDVYKKLEVTFDRTLQNKSDKAFRGLTRKIVDEYIGLLNRCTVA